MAVAVCMSLTACDMDKFFELDRPETNPMQNVKDLEYMVVSPYTAHFQIPGWQSPLAMISYYGELAADNSLANPWAIEQEAVYWYPRQMSTFDVTGEQMELSFRVLYGGVGTCNVPLTFIEEREQAGLPVFDYITEDEKKILERQKGELYFMRAYSYWMISRIFMPPYNETNANKRFIPLITKLDPTQEALRKPYMGTVAEVYDQMVNDLKKAKSLLPEVNDKGRGRANKFAASALLMRVYWLMGNNTEALNECNFIIKEGVEDNAYYNLTEAPIRAFNRNAEPTYTTNPVAREVIWEAVITADGTNQPIAVARMSKSGGYNFKSKDGSYWPDDDNWEGGLRGENFQHGGWACAYWNPRTIKYIGWAKTDNPTDLENYVPSEEANKDKRFTQLHAFLKGNKAGGYKEKYEMTFPHIKWNTFWGDKYFRAPYARFSNVPLIRLPEIYLTRAQLVLAANPTQALKDVNVVRLRAGLDPLLSVTEADIEKERIKEFGFEANDRLTYLVAMKKTIDGGKTSLDGFNLDADNNDPMVGTPIPAMNPPYANMYVPLPSIEFLYSGSTSSIN